MKTKYLPFHEKFTITSKAWWLDGVLNNPNSGKLEVARVHAVHKTMRYPADHELEFAENFRGERHRAFAWNKWLMDESYTGEQPGYMLGLSADELAMLVACSDYQELGNTPCKEVTSSPRPASHDKEPVSWDKYQQAIDDLQNEGF